MAEVSVRRRGTGDPEATLGPEVRGLEPVGGSSAGPAKVSSFLGGTSSLLKRSPIPASPDRCEEQPNALRFSVKSLRNHSGPDAKKRGVPARAPRVWVSVGTMRQRPAPAASICFWILSRLNDPGVWLGG